MKMGVWNFNNRSNNQTNNQIVELIIEIIIKSIIKLNDVLKFDCLKNTSLTG